VSGVASDRTRWGDLIVGGGARREQIRRRHGNGLDTIEVDRGGHRLILTFLEHAPGNVHPANIRIEGPRGAPAVSATSVRRGAEDDPRLEQRLLVTLTGPGGLGTYTLRLVERAAGGLPGWAPLEGLDPRFAQAGFTFDLDVPVRGPEAGRAAAAGAGPAQASYLARDYQGLRQLILDRMAQTMPAWTETHAADIGITLVEMLAYVGDDLSYYQDAVATEAYLATARQRISVRRHARLVDYLLGEGAQARAWVCLTVSDAARLPLRDLEFAAAPALPAGAAPVLSGRDPGSPGAAGRRVYTPVRAWHGAPPAAVSGPAGHDPAGPGPQVAVSPAHNEVALWSWGERDSWLRAEATTAVLADQWTDTDHGESAPRALSLQAGDVIVLEAITGPGGTGAPDPAQRHPVRLTAARRSVDRLYDQPLLEVTWSDAEALPFELQVSAAVPDGGSVPCAVARGNAVLVGDGAAVTEVLDAGTAVLTQPQLTWSCPYPEPVAVARHQARLLRRLPDAWREQVEEWRRAAARGEVLGERRRAQLRRLLGEDVLAAFGLAAGGPEMAEREAEGLGRLLADAERLLAPRVRRVTVLAALARASGPLEPVLLREVADDWGADLARPLGAHEPASWGPAAEATSQDPRRARPLLRLAPADASAGGPWTTVRDVVGTMPGSRQVMVEVDDTGRARLRFSPGDQPAGPVTASYQAGQGSAGNVPAEAINAIIPRTPSAAATAAVVQGVRNPLPAAGGTDPESIRAAKAAVPGAFRAGQPRALVAADYTALAEQVTGVRRAATVLRWTGRRYLADVTVQPTAGEDPSQELLAAVHEALWPARRIGQDLRVRPPRYRPLVISLNVDVGADVVRADALAALAALLSSGRQADGTPGLFNPERLDFGQPVYASAIVAAVQDLPGVDAVVLTRFGFLAPPAGPAPRRRPERLRLRDSEIARLDNDPLAPEHGYATINLRGGR
jgi:predicted phage baseplate assembly protein